LSLFRSFYSATITQCSKCAVDSYALNKNVFSMSHGHHKCAANSSAYTENMRHNVEIWTGEVTFQLITSTYQTNIPPTGRIEHTYGVS